MTTPLTLVCLAFAALSALLWRRQVKLKREAYIRSFVLPKGLFEKLMQKHPQLATKDCQLVAQGLRQFFLAHLKSGRQYVSMPSQVADDLWHEFILYTRNYQQFCQRAFGRFLHHTPAEALQQGQRGNAGIKRCWQFACHEENINPAKPTRLPLLFALDGKLQILNGYLYAADCSGWRHRNGSDASNASGPVYCAAELGTGGSSCGGDTDTGFGSGHGDADSGGSGSDGGGSDGGGSCGGGGCGGD